jgi:hypothetical protein
MEKADPLGVEYAEHELVFECPTHEGRKWVTRLNVNTVITQFWICYD